MRVRGRLAPDAMYPAGVVGVHAKRMTLRSGLRFRVLESGSPEGEPVVLVHGWGACTYTFRFAIAALAQAGRRVVGFDLRGHGLSDKPVDPEAYATALLVVDLGDLLDACALARADLIGHSLGGAIALRFALARPDRVRRLVLAAPVGLTRVPLHDVARILTPRFTERFARYLPPRWVTAFLLRGAYGQPRRVMERTIDEYWAPSQFKEYYFAVRGLLEKFDWDPVAPEELRTLAREALVILGTADRLIRGAESAARSMPNASVASIDGAGHLGIEECPAEFNEILLRFLSGGKISVAPSAAMS